MTEPSTTTQTQELKPCPFCKSARVENWKSRPPDRAYDIWCVFCHQCSSEGPEALDAITAATLWNTRAPSDTEQRLREALEQIDLVALLDDLESARDYLSRGPWEASEPANQKFTVKIASYQYECPEGSAQIRAEQSSIPTRCLVPFGIIHRDDAEGIVLMRNRLEDAIQVVEAARTALQPQAEQEQK